MNALDKILNRVDKESSNTCIVFEDKEYSYKEVFAYVNETAKQIEDKQIDQGDVVCLLGDYSIESISYLLNLIKIKTVLIPLTSSTYERVNSNLDEIGIDFLIDLNNKGQKIKKIVSKKDLMI